MAGRGFSQRRTYGLVQVDPKMVRRVALTGDADVRERLRGLAAERRRFGYRRLGILLEREGVSMNKKKLFRLYREEGLAVRGRRWRCRMARTSVRSWTSSPTRSAGADASGSCASSMTSPARPWPWLSTSRSAAIVSDNGTEMTSRAMLEWTNRTGIDWH
jgi:putative transposase